MVNDINRSFDSPYYRSPNYRTRYPEYLRSVAPPPPMAVNFLDELGPKTFEVRKKSDDAAAKAKPNASFGDAYYQSADYRTRYPEYLKPVVPPTTTVNFFGKLRAKKRDRAKETAAHDGCAKAAAVAAAKRAEKFMANCEAKLRKTACREKRANERTRSVAAAAETETRPPTAEATTTTQQQQTRREKTTGRGGPQVNTTTADVGTMTVVGAPEDNASADADVTSTHRFSPDDREHLSAPPSHSPPRSVPEESAPPSHSPPRSVPEEPTPPPSRSLSWSVPEHDEFSPHVPSSPPRSTSATEDAASLPHTPPATHTPLPATTTTTTVVEDGEQLHFPPPPPPPMSEDYKTERNTPPPSNDLPVPSDDHQRTSVIPQVPAFPPPPPPIDDDDDAGQLDPLERFRRTARRFQRENRLRKRLAAVRNEKAQAQAIAEQAKQVVLAAKSGWRDDIYCADDDGDDCRKRKTATVVRQSAGHDTSEYAELERLGLGRYDGGGRWVPNSRNKLKDKLIYFQ